MQIRTRITLQFSFIVSIILILFSIAIYYFSSNYREQEFYKRLKEKALTTAKFLVDVDEIDLNLLKIIDRNTVSILRNGKVIILDTQDKVLYSSPEGIALPYTSKLLDQVRLEKELEFHIGDNEALGMVFEGKYDRFVVLAAAYDKYGIRKLNFLKYLLIIGVFIAIVLTTLLGFLFAKQSLSPISKVVNQVDMITFSNLNLRVNEGNGTDEIAQLAIKFNRMLERLKAAFEMQRSFVDHASHELRTPLTTLTGHIEVAMMEKNINEEGTQVLSLLLKEIKQLNKLSNDLLDLAHANLDISEIELGQVRIDETIANVRADIIRKNNRYAVLLNFDEFPENENWLTVNANEQLLKSAIFNVIENACKYSSNAIANVNLSFDATHIHVLITDTGIGMTEQDLKYIYDPFYRASNAKHKSGNGIGLPLTHRIIQLHKGNIDIQSKLNEGTSVLLSIPHI